jgi:hypothetical protein
MLLHRLSTDYLLFKPRIKRILRIKRIKIAIWIRLIRKIRLISSLIGDNLYRIFKIRVNSCNPDEGRDKCCGEPV